MSRMADNKVCEPKTDADWKGKCDAETLVQAEKIISNEKRFKAAKKWISLNVIESQEELKAMLKLESKMDK